MTGANDLEEMCRLHFNEPILTDRGLGRCIGYGEDDCDAYVIIDYMDGRRIWHTCVGGYYWLDRLKGQAQVAAYNGEIWDDLTRMDSLLSLNKAPKQEQFLFISERKITASSAQTPPPSPLPRSDSSASE